MTESPPEETTQEPGTSKDYVAAMLDWAAADISQVYLRVTAAIGLALVYVTQIPMERLTALNQIETYALFAGLACLGIAAILYFVYVQQTHLRRRDIARCYVLKAPPDPKAVLGSEFKKWRVRCFGFGNTAFILGVALLAIVLWPIVTMTPPTPASAKPAAATHTARSAASSFAALRAQTPNP